MFLLLYKYLLEQSSKYCHIRRQIGRHIRRISCLE